MSSEQFTFFVLTHEGFTQTSRFMNRTEADREYDRLVAEQSTRPEGEYVAYYCASVGGLVNSWRAA